MISEEYDNDGKGIIVIANKDLAIPDMNLSVNANIDIAHGTIDSIIGFSEDKYREGT